MLKVADIQSLIEELVNVKDDLDIVYKSYRISKDSILEDSFTVEKVDSSDNDKYVVISVVDSIESVIDIVSI